MWEFFHLLAFLKGFNSNRKGVSWPHNGEVMLAVGAADGICPLERSLRVPLQALLSVVCSTFMGDLEYSQGLKQITNNYTSLT